MSILNPTLNKGKEKPIFAKLNALKLRSEVPVFKAGDKVVVKSKIKEGTKERVQAFEGIVLARKGAGIGEGFTVRRMSAGGVGVERVFPLHCPTIVSIEVKVVGFVRRAKINYLRGLVGKKAKIKDRNLKLTEAGAINPKAKAKKSKRMKKAPAKK